MTERGNVVLDLRYRKEVTEADNYFGIFQHLLQSRFKVELLLSRFHDSR